MTNQQSPFVPGARVAVETNATHSFNRDLDYREDFVLKVHKSGNFTLRGDLKHAYPVFTHDR